MSQAHCQYRVTKYNPPARDDSGAYLKGDWTSISDVGRTFNGAVLTEGEYLRTEGAYVHAAASFMREAGILSFAVRGLENTSRRPNAPIEGSTLALDDVESVLRALLREEYWCRLEAPEAFIHVGYDYYMYLGVPAACPRAERASRELGLYVEKVQSPYAEHAA
jgi:hypothetical protein